MFSVLEDGGTAVPQPVQYSLLIAGDGANSVIRRRLEELREVRCKRFYRNVG